MQDVKGLLKPSCFLNLILQEKPGYSAVLTVLKSSREAALAWLPGLRRIPTSTLVSPRFAFPGWLSREHTSAPLSHTPGRSCGPVLLFIYSLYCRAEVFAGREGLLRAGCGEPFPAPRPAARSAPAQPRGTAEAPTGFWGLNLETRAGGLKSPLAARTLLLPAPGYLPNKRQHPTREGLGSQGAIWMCCPHVGLLQEFFLLIPICGP